MYSSLDPVPDAPPRPALPRLLAGGYLLLLGYGSLFPLRDWHSPDGSIVATLMRLPGNPPPSDVATNLLVYVPAGFLLMLALPGRRIPRAVAAAMLCALLSISLESLQAWLPSRDTSGLDVLLNSTGALFGALTALVFVGTWHHPIRPPAYPYALRHEPATRAALIALALWLGSQWAPFVPSLDPWRLWLAVKPLWLTVVEGGFEPRIAAAYALELLVIAAALTGMLRNPYPAALWLAGAVVILLAGKVLMVGRVVSAEALLGMAVGTLLAGLVPGPFTRRRAVLALAALAATWALTSLTSMATLTAPFRVEPREPFQWILLSGHLSNPITGIMDLFDTAWPGAVAAYLALRSGMRRKVVLVGGTLAVMAYAALLEWLQRWQPGSYPDVTDILVPAAAWVITFLVGARTRRPGHRSGNAP